MERLSFFFAFFFLSLFHTGAEKTKTKNSLIPFFFYFSTAFKSALAACSTWSSTNDAIK